MAIDPATGQPSGKVTIDINWWLFFLNISKQVLSAPGTPVPLPPIYNIAVFDSQDVEPADATQSPRMIANSVQLESQDVELAGADIAGLPLRISNAQLLQADPDVTPTLRDLTNAIVLGSDPLLVDPVSVITSQTLTFAGLAQRILGDFSNGTFSNRVLFQTSTLNGNTTIGTIPNGTGAQSGFRAHNTSDPANASIGVFACSTLGVVVNSTLAGTGTQLPILFQIAAVTKAQVLTNGDFNTSQGVTDTGYSYQTPTTGFSITIGNNIQTLILDPAGALLTGTITMPPTPGDGQVVRITCTQNITTLTVAANAGQSIKNAPTGFTTSLTGDQGYEFIYRLANTTWFRLQ